MASDEDIERRLRILEGALGINLDTSSVCSGDPLDCPADPCDEERCPMRNNLVQRMYRDYNRLERKVLITEMLMEELCDAGVVTEKMLRRAKYRAELDGIIPEMYATDLAIKEAEGQEEVVKVLRAKLERLAKRMHELHVKIEEMS